jgi:hypothetical protein
MARELKVVIERDEAGYLVASVPALRGCHREQPRGNANDLAARARAIRGIAGGRWTGVRSGGGRAAAA